MIYTIDEDYLRELFLNLLVSSSDTNYINRIHASFVDVIKYLSPYDALILKRFVSNPCYHLEQLQINYEGARYSNELPNLFSYELMVTEDYFIVSSCLGNLIHLGLIEISDRPVSVEIRDSFD